MSAGYGLLHEIPAQLGILERLTKKAIRLTCGEDAQQVMTDLWNTMIDTCMKPTAIEVPADIWRYFCPHVDRYGTRCISRLFNSVVCKALLTMPVSTWYTIFSTTSHVLYRKALAVSQADPVNSCDDDLLSKVEDAVDLIQSSKRPIIIVGSGAQEASAEVLELCTKVGGPVLSTRTGRGILSDRHSLSINMPTGHALWSQADLVIAIGTRFQVCSVEA